VFIEAKSVNAIKKLQKELTTVTKELKSCVDDDLAWALKSEKNTVCVYMYAQVDKVDE